MKQWMVAMLAVVLVGCGGAPFTLGATADDLSEADPSMPGVDGDLAVALDAGDSETEADAKTNVGHDSGDAGGLRVDAGDAGPSVNAFPGSPYEPAACRSAADCLSDTQWDFEGAAPIALYCGALEGVGPNLSEQTLLSGDTQCRPTEDVSGTIVLCLSDLDCSGYACVTQTCPVATYAPYDGGGDAVQIGITPILVSYCQGTGTAPSGCH
jgi:hypothetical protein